MKGTEPAQERLRELSFPALIRLGAGRGPLVNRWDVWSDHRKARETTSHADDGVEAAADFARIPAFPEDARALLAELPEHRGGMGGARAGGADPTGLTTPDPYPQP